MNFAYLLLGGNMGDREAVIAKAAEFIHASCGKIIRKSSLYESEPWGFETNNQFVNQVILIETVMDAGDVVFPARAGGDAVHSPLAPTVMNLCKQGIQHRIS